MDSFIPIKLKAIHSIWKPRVGSFSCLSNPPSYWGKLKKVTCLKSVLTHGERKRDRGTRTYRERAEVTCKCEAYKFNMATFKYSQKIILTTTLNGKGTQGKVPGWVDWISSGCLHQPLHCGRCCCRQSNLPPPSEERCLMPGSGRCHSWAWQSEQKRESHLSSCSQRFCENIPASHIKNTGDTPKFFPSQLVPKVPQ